MVEREGQLREEEEKRPRPSALGIVETKPKVRDPQCADYAPGAHEHATATAASTAPL
jgi:hypothetical protein